MRIESVIKKLKWPARLLLFAFAYFMIGNWIEKHSENLNEVVSLGSFEEFDLQKYEKFKKAKTFYKYVKYLPWVNTRDPKKTASSRWDNPVFEKGFSQDFHVFFENHELFKKVYDRTQNLNALYGAISYPSSNLGLYSSGIKYSDLTEYFHHENPNILLNTNDSLIFVDPSSQESILISGKVKSEYFEVLSQLNSSLGYGYNDIFDYEELFLKYELESFVLKHEHAFRTFGYGGYGDPAYIFENTGKRLGIYPTE